jgi:hypothetical protein
MAPGWHNIIVKVQANITQPQPLMVFRSEIYDKPCDTGSPIPVIQKEFPGFDFSTVDPVFPDMSSPARKGYVHNRTAVLPMAQYGLEKLCCRHEKLITVVSHSALSRLAASGAQYANADYRIFDFEHRKNDSDAFLLQERTSTSTQGGGMGRCVKENVTIGSGDLPPDSG